MKIQDRLRGALKGFTAKSVGSSVSGKILRNYQKESSFRPQDQMRGITYKAIDKVALSLSVYRPQVTSNGDTLENHPLYNLWKNPNPHMSASDFTHMYGMLMQIYGETFWYKAKGERTNKTKELYLLNPVAMELVISGGELTGYVLHKANGNQVPFSLDEIYHDKLPNPFNEWRGMSILERSAVYVDTEIVSSVFTLNYMKNNASPSGIVSLPDMDANTFKQFASQWREGYEGPENAGKTAFIRGGEASFKAVGATLKDVDAEVTRNMAKEDVLMMLEVPKPLLGMADGDGLGRASIETLYYIYNREKIEPMMKRLDQVWTHLLKEIDQDTRKHVAHESPVPEDKDYMLAVHTKGVNVFMTVNEVREQMGLPPIKGGDEIMPKNTVPTTDQKSVKRVTLKTVDKMLDIKKLNEDQEKFRSELVENTKLYETKAKTALSKIINKQEAEVIGKINASSKSYEEWLFNVLDYTKEIGDELAPIIVELMEVQSQNVTNFISGQLFTINAEVRDQVKANILRIAGIFNQDTIVALQATLTEGSTAGESLAKLKHRVEDTFSDAKGYRAERIARTESLRASNSTAERVYQESGYKTVKWFANPGACKFCESMNGRTKVIGSNFLNIGDVLENADGAKMQVDYDNVGTPPLHPQCSCSLVPED
jgi:HK97 family phage portal protein